MSRVPLDPLLAACVLVPLFAACISHQPLPTQPSIAAAPLAIVVALEGEAGSGDGQVRERSRASTSVLASAVSGHLSFVRCRRSTPSQ